MQKVEFMTLNSVNQTFHFNTWCFLDFVHTLPNKDIDILFAQTTQIGERKMEAISNYIEHLKAVKNQRL